jgi:hypothetical protein
MIEQPYLLELEPNAMSKASSTKAVVELLTAIAPKPKEGWHRATVTFGNPSEQVSYQKLVEETAKHGYNRVQLFREASDDIFGVGIGMTCAESDHGVVLDVEYGGHKETLRSPYYYNPVEWDLSEDILAYRQEACLWSNEYLFTDCVRNYRAYLFSCIALVDAFINRHIIMYKHRGYNSQDLSDLQRCPRLEERLDLFMKVSANKGLSAINQGGEWIDFKKLRALRNSITHIEKPVLAYHLNDFAVHFNYVRAGIGGLLKRIRYEQGKQSLCFIDRLVNAPLAYSNAIKQENGVRKIARRNGSKA